MTCSFLLTPSDPTLTTHNVMEMTKGVKYDDLPFILGISHIMTVTRVRRISKKYQSDEL